MSYVFVPFRPDNAEKVCAGSKTTTARTRKEAQKIGLKPGEKALFRLGPRVFQIQLRGELTIDEAGGTEAMTASEDFGPGGPKFPTTRRWLAGQGALFVYDISPPF